MPRNGYNTTLTQDNANGYNTFLQHQDNKACLAQPPAKNDEERGHRASRPRHEETNTNKARLRLQGCPGPTYPTHVPRGSASRWQDPTKLEEAVDLRVLETTYIAPRRPMSSVKGSAGDASSLSSPVGPVRSPSPDATSGTPLAA